MNETTDNNNTTQVIPTPFVLAFNQLAQEVHSTARAKGWWDGDELYALMKKHMEETHVPYDVMEKVLKRLERNVGESIALMHSELSEALEAARHGNPPDDKVPSYSGIETELADVVIRIADVSCAHGWRVAEAIEAKIAYNKTREYKHGGKQF